jgi:hypothetical protein
MVAVLNSEWTARMTRILGEHLDTLSHACTLGVPVLSQGVDRPAVARPWGCTDKQDAIPPLLEPLGQRKEG